MESLRQPPEPVYLSKRQWWGFAVLLAATIPFGYLVVLRSALQPDHKGDLEVYLRAAWAVRAGQDIYDITDRGRWHYCYPSLLAIALTPLADPPEEVELEPAVPLAVSVAICYVLNLILLCLAVHWAANALEQSGVIPWLSQQPRWGHAWLGLRLMPILTCLVPIGHTLMRGQINLLVLFFVCAIIAALLQGKRLRAGFWLAAAICVKLIPAFLLVYPLWRRDGRMLAGCAAGLLIGLLAIPAAVFGPAEAWRQCCKLNDVLVLPALGLGDDRSRAEELIDVVATDSQSLLTVLHNTLYLDRVDRPRQASASVRYTAELLGGLLTLLTLWAARRRKETDGIAMLLVIGGLVLNMMFLSPVCHLHYYSMAVPLIMGLVASDWQRAGRPELSLSTTCLLFAFAVLQAPAHFPGLAIFRDCGLATYAGLAVWFAGISALRRTFRQTPELMKTGHPRRAAAA